MTRYQTATSHQERPVFFPSGDETLFGVVTDPTGEPKRVGVILLYGGGYTMTSYYNQYWTRMARRLGGLGFHALRFDHHGNGDATGRVDGFDHRKPFSDDMEAAIDFMAHQGADRFVLVGDCLGGRAALVAAANVAVVDGVFMISAMVRDGKMDQAEDWARSYGLGHYVRRSLRWSTIRKLADRDMRRALARVAATKLRLVSATAAAKVGNNRSANGIASHRFLDALETVLKRGSSVYFVFGDQDVDRFGEFQQARESRLGEIIADAESAVEIKMVEGTITEIQDVSAQDEIIELVSDWVSRIPTVQTDARL